MGREQFYWVFPLHQRTIWHRNFDIFVQTERTYTRQLKRQRTIKNVALKTSLEEETSLKQFQTSTQKEPCTRVMEKSKKPFQKKIRHTQISWPVLFITMSRLINYKTGQLIRAEGTGSTHLKPIIGPGSEFHDTRLFVEGKVFDVNLTGRLVNCRWFPFHQTVPPEGGLGGEGHLKVSIGTEMFQAKGRIVKRKNMAQRNSIILTFCFKIKLRIMFH